MKRGRKYGQDLVNRVYFILFVVLESVVVLTNGIVSFFLLPFLIEVSSCKRLFYVTIRDLNTLQKQYKYSDLLWHCVFTANDHRTQ